MRKFLFYALRPFVQYHAYAAPGAPGGYRGYFKLFGKVISFVDRDGVKEFSW